jgi:conserved repeat domain/conserved repeat domain
MKKLINFIKNHSIISGSVLVAAVAPALVWAWGPARPSFTIEKPADYITFNSITNNPVIGGDEKDFVGIREVGSNAKWTNNMKVQNGKEYYVRMYVHNNAASNLNLVAENVVAKLNVPTTTAKNVTVQGQISASNAKPNTVWDEATFSSDNDFNLAYVAGSALFENNGMGTTKLPDSIVNNTGAKLGYDKLDGKIPGCFQYAGYVTVKVKAQVSQPQEKTNIDLAKTVRNKTNGEKSWVETTNAKSGDTVQFQIHAKNTGSAGIQNLVIRDILPKGLNYVAGSTKLYNTSNPKGLKVSDNVIQNSGINIGSYQPNGDAYVRFDATVSAENSLPVCGDNTLTNIAQASDQKIVKNDTASVKVTKKCETPKNPVYKCEALSLNIVRKDEKQITYAADTKYSVKDTEFTGTKYVVKNSKNEVVAEKVVNGGTKFEITVPNNVNEKYTVTSIIITKNGENSNTNCEKSFETKAPAPVPSKPELVCRNITINQISRTKFEFNTSYTVNNITFVGVKYIVKDQSGKIVIEKTVNNGSKLTLDIEIVGKFTISSTVITKDGENSNSNCEKSFEVKREEKPSILIKKTVNNQKNAKIEANTDFNYEITVSNNGNVDLKDVVVTDRAPANITFVSADSGEIKDNTLTLKINSLKVGESKTITIKSQATATGITTVNTACVDTPTIPGDNDGCDSAKVEIPKKQTPPTPTPNNPTPNIPTELPQTGANTLSAILGLTSMVTAFGYYFASRKAARF